MASGAIVSTSSSSSSSSSSSYSDMTSLHLAAQAGKTEEIRKLLELGGEVRVQDARGNTPLHLAARRGDSESIRLLVDAGAPIDARNLDGDSPLDLLSPDLVSELGQLLTWSSPPLTSVTKEAMSSSSSLVSREGTPLENFKESYKTGDQVGQLLSLQRVADDFLGQEKFLEAAHFLNGALTLVKSTDPDLSRSLFDRLEEIERRFVLKKWGATLTADPGYVAKRRGELARIRSQVAYRLEGKASPEELQAMMTEGYRKLLEGLINDSIAHLGRGAPAVFAFAGLGSIARRELSPYSDLEFICLLETASPENLDYFRALNELLALKVVNMGETAYKFIRFEGGERSLTPSGFHLDRAGLSPLGVQGSQELIGSPSDLAALLRNGERIFVNAMSLACHITGDSRLTVAYQQEVRTVFNPPKPSLFSTVFGGGGRRRSRKTRAVELMENYIGDFQPQLNQVKIDDGTFEVKIELYRPLHGVVNALALYHGLSSQNTFDQINELQRGNLINHEGGEQLKRALRRAVLIRFETHLFYENEREALYYYRDSEREKAMLISPDLAQEMVEIYRTLVPLHERARAFIRGDLTAFLTSSFYDPGIGSREGGATWAIFNPSSPAALSDLGRSQAESGRFGKALRNFNRARTLLKEVHGDRPHPEVAAILRNLGNGCRGLGRYGEAIEHYEASISMRREIDGGGPHPIIADTLIELGGAYKGLGQFTKAIECYGHSLSMRRAIDGESDHPTTAASLMGLGTVFQEMGRFHEAFDHYNKSLMMSSALNGSRPRLDVAATLMNMGLVLEEMGEYSSAVRYYSDSIEMKRAIYNGPQNRERTL